MTGRILQIQNAVRPYAEIRPRPDDTRLISRRQTAGIARVAFISLLALLAARQTQRDDGVAVRVRTGVHGRRRSVERRGGHAADLAATWDAEVEFALQPGAGQALVAFFAGVSVVTVPMSMLASAIICLASSMVS